MQDFEVIMDRYPYLVNERYCARCGYEEWKCQHEGYTHSCQTTGEGKFVNPKELLKELFD